MDSKICALDDCNPTNGNVGCPPNGSATAMHSSVAPSVVASFDATLGRHLVEIGVNDVFSVPGHFNLTLFDHLIAEPDLNLVGCCNELNAGYTTDGYARCRGVGACAVTFTVGGLSILNAISGAYSENLPLICIVGGSNSNDYGTNRIPHPTFSISCNLLGIPHPTFSRDPVPFTISPT
ncbi:pyruvate decarboxylase 1-like [Malania oleifera]|uniref:pyruvate decarboxylase 1-like n=1 Tax=Malania oleifera TaxID=397392 RepID=UPI0025AE9E83|nr:pyruvate decarboxylase 1-like [Malania oleifera]